MNNNALISIIVPVYNVEKYLRQCIDSIISQTYTNLEIILVDDGSPDNCGAICDEYAAKDNRIIVIHKENGGQSHARNAALDIATGEYIGFVDSDDWIEPGMFEFLYKNSKQSDVDIFMCGHYMSFKNSERPSVSCEETLILNREEAVKEAVSDSLIKGYAWDKLYKKHIFDNIRYPNGKIYEDVFILYDILLCTKKIGINTSPKYHYRQRKGGTVTSYTPKTINLVEAHRKNMKLIETNYPDYMDMAKSKFIEANLWAMRGIVFTSRYRQIPEYNEVKSTIKKNIDFILKSKYFKKITKIKLFALCVNVLLFKLLLFIISLVKNNTNQKLYD